MARNRKVARARLGNCVQNRRLGALVSLGRAGLLLSGKPAKCCRVSRTAPDRRSARQGWCSTGRSSVAGQSFSTPDSLSEQNFENLPTVEILSDRTNRSFQVSHPAGTDRRSPKAKAATGAAMRGRRRSTDEFGTRRVMPPVARNSIDPFMGRSVPGKVGNIFLARNSPERLAYPVGCLRHECEVELATSPFSVRVMGPNRKPGFGRLTIVINRASGFIQAASVQQRGRNPDIGYLVHQAPTHSLVCPAGGWPTSGTAVLIVRIRTDDRMYRSLGHRTACRRYGIILTKTINSSPVDSSVAERAFSAIFEYFVKNLPGQGGCGADDDIVREDLLSSRDVEILFQRWVAAYGAERMELEDRETRHDSRRPVEWW